MNKWLAVRAGFVLFCLAYGAIFAPELLGDAGPPENWTRPYMLAVLFGFGVVALLFVIGIQVVNPRSAPKWRYPSWSISPFLLTEPLQPFHLIGYAILAQGVGNLINGAIGGVLNTDGIVFAAFGAGIVVGVHVSALLYRWKMTHGT